MDIGAYFTGKKFGKIKLAKSISPNKTWEGLIGGLVFAIMLSFLASKIIDFDTIILAFFSISLGLISVVGDLTVSMFKRNSNQKDTGKILPGHGGFLDRIDSIISSAPLFALGCIYFLF
jgi:phosphatidate cytidylyltransferase